jgi:hypothetical protein
MSPLTRSLVPQGLSVYDGFNFSELMVQLLQFSAIASVFAKSGIRDMSRRRDRLQREAHHRRKAM